MRAEVNQNETKSGKGIIVVENTARLDVNKAFARSLTPLDRALPIAPSDRLVVRDFITRLRLHSLILIIVIRSNYSVLVYGMHFDFYIHMCFVILTLLSLSLFPVRRSLLFIWKGKRVAAACIYLAHVPHTFKNHSLCFLKRELRIN